MLSQTTGKNVKNEFIYYVALIVWYLILAYFSLPSMLVASYLWWKLKEEEDTKYLFRLIALASCILTLIIGLQNSQLLTKPLENILTRQVVFILSAPFLTYVIKGSWWFMSWFKPKSASALLDFEQRREGKHIEKARDRIIANGSYEEEPGYTHIGHELKPQKFSKHSGVLQKNKSLYIEDKIRSEHTIVLGSIGSGKTTWLLGYALKTIRLGRKFFWCDGKGEYDTAVRIATMIYTITGRKVPIFVLGAEEKGSVYNCFTGNKESLFNRYLNMAGANVEAGDNKVFSDTARTALSLVCGIGYEDIEAPKSFDELNYRLNEDVLREMYRGDSFAQSVIDDISKGNTNGIKSARLSLNPFIMEFRHKMHDSGFSLDDVSGACFVFDTQSAGASCKRAFGIFLEDFKFYIKNIKDYPVTLVVDEVGMLCGEDTAKEIQALTGLARQYDAEVVIATQDVSQLGKERDIRLVLSTINSRVILRLDSSEELAILSGTIRSIDNTIQHREGDPTGLGSINTNRDFAFDPDVIGKFAKGQFAFSRHKTVSIAQYVPEQDFVENNDSVDLYEKIESEQTETPPIGQSTPYEGIVIKKVEYKKD